MRKIRIIGTCFLLGGMFFASLLPVSAQNEGEGELAKNAIYLEVLGAGLFYSVNYAHRFNQIFSLSAGYGYLDSTLLSVPLLASLALGGESHAFEITAGGNFTLAYNGVVPVVGAGYRYWPGNGGFFFRVTGMVLVFGRGLGLPPVLPWAGLSFGTAF